ncbi:polyprenol monophosphomannose synthase [Planobispora longispora]|uniref:Dolichol-phosphate mannosyltransferase n=1 Tax=Planobispora longispora TaxID=28887 RepID=A0A8J3RJJ0_9ACTN|nr:polyprenol monophosphomannose synthase [Planobispora longispora]GIH76852.1 dolichol-phosphate mannosyltransferase [Planobispora longispora]
MERTFGKVLVIVPTYNERENLPMIVERVRASVPEAHVLVADDNSPDGTGRVADGLAADDDHVHVLHRPGKQGLGAAYIAGFRWGLAEGYDILVEMDADGSHQPEELPKLLEAVAGGADLAIGSRYVSGGKVVNWPASREFLSRGANVYTRMMLGMPVRDATAGFRAYRASTLEKIGLDGVESQGYCFQVDLTLRTARHGLRVAEVPITFVERTVGASKMSRTVITEALWRVTVWGVSGLPHRLRRPR